MATTPVESEVKVPVAELAVVRETLIAAEATLIQASTRERNTLFDFAGQPLTASQQALRLRRYGEQWLLTFKGRAHYEGAIKHREELQLEVSDGDCLATIFDRLGLQPSISYEKDRELWQLDGIEICLDHTPIGDFIELEGPADRLPTTAARLGLDLATAVRGSYLSLWQAFREQASRSGNSDHDLPRDMLFHDSAEG